MFQLTVKDIVLINFARRKTHYTMIRTAFPWHPESHESNQSWEKTVEDFKHCSTTKDFVIHLIINLCEPSFDNDSSFYSPY